jgi:hypothetical protein
MMLKNESKIPYIFILLMFGSLSLFLQSACNKNCDDCTPVTHYAFGIRNTTSVEVKFTFFLNQDSTVLQMVGGEELTTIIVQAFGISGPLTTTPLNVFNLEGRSAFDSVSVVTNNNLTLYTAEDCSLTNPLCVESYERSGDLSSDGLITTEIFIYNYE